MLPGLRLALCLHLRRYVPLRPIPSLGPQLQGIRDSSRVCQPQSRSPLLTMGSVLDSLNKYSLAGCLLHLEHCLQFCLETVAEFLRQGSAQMSPPQRGLPCPEIEIRSPHVPRPGHLSSWYTLGFLTCFSVSFYCCFSIFPH